MKTTSLELSKRIAELEGGKGTTKLWWKHNDGYYLVTKDSRYDIGRMVCPAYTTDELLERLPASTCMGKKTDIETKSIARYYVETFEHHSNNIHADTPAEALGLLYEYLLKEGIIKSKE